MVEKRGRAANGQGSIRPREAASGTVWDAQISVKEQGTGRPRRLSKRGFPTQKAAIDWAKKASRAGAVAAGGNEKVADAVGRFWSGFDGALNTRRAYEKTLNDLASRMGGRRMRAITPTIVSEVVNQPGASINTSKTRRTAVQRFLRWAEGEGMVTRQQREAVAAIRLEGSKPGRRIPATREQVEAVTRLDSEWADLWALLAGTGIRSGEARGLDHTHLIGERRILIERQAGPRKGDPYGPTKTGRPRVVGAPAALVERLRDRGAGLLFQVDGMPVSQKVADERLKADCARAGVAPFTMHQFRHYWATEAFRRGVRAKVVQEQLGHVSIGITLDTYTSLDGTALEDAAELLHAEL